MNYCCSIIPPLWQQSKQYYQYDCEQKNCVNNWHKFHKEGIDVARVDTEVPKIKEENLAQTFENL